jgi:hypothetical protein
MENSDSKQTAIEYCKIIRKDMKQLRETSHPISQQMEESFKKICKIPIDENLDKYPELKAEVDKQKAFEVQALILWEKEVQRVMKENNLTEKDIKEEEEIES